MLRIFLVFALFFAFVFASSNYTVRLAVFKHDRKLQKALDRYPPALRRTIKTYRRKGYSYAYTLPTSDRATLKKLLPAYRKVFSDAYIEPIKLK